MSFSQPLISVLVVEDDVYVGEVVKLSLEDACQARVTVSCTGAAALSCMVQDRFNLAFVDVILPDMSGFQVAERAANLNIPVLLTSGDPDALVICQRNSLPVLAKPFLPSSLVQKTADLVRRGQTDIAAIAASCAALHATNGELQAVIRNTRQLLQESAAARQRRSAVRYDALGGYTSLGSGLNETC